MHRPGRGGAHYGFQGHESVEDNNSLREDELKGKIGALKSLTIDIGNEVETRTILTDD